MQGRERAKAFLLGRPRNSRILDIWSFVHLGSGVLAGWLMDPFIALLILVLWEPLEILVLSPFLARFHIEFGHETLRNSVSDILFDAVGVAVGYWLLRDVWAPPFVLF